jgi:hypothetical protein
LVPSDVRSDARADRELAAQLSQWILGPDADRLAVWGPDAAVLVSYARRCPFAETFRPSVQVIWTVQAVRW